MQLILKKKHFRGNIKEIKDTSKYHQIKPHFPVVNINKRHKHTCSYIIYAQTQAQISNMGSDFGNTGSCRRFYSCNGQKGEKE